MLLLALTYFLRLWRLFGRKLASVMSHNEAESRWPHAPDAGHETHESRVGVDAGLPRSIAVLEL
jgi:hypothetical protein